MSMSPHSATPLSPHSASSRYLPAQYLPSVELTALSLNSGYKGAFEQFRNTAGHINSKSPNNHDFADYFARMAKGNELLARGHQTMWGNLSQQLNRLETNEVHQAHENQRMNAEINQRLDRLENLIAGQYSGHTGHSEQSWWG